jgi:hypothetical protein
MYSKDEYLVNEAGSAMAQLAYIQPDLVLRLVMDRFQVSSPP